MDFSDHFCAISTYFWQKMTQNELILRDSYFWEIADLFLIGI
jgi:hypothetical protein